ncbi:unnamed protein product, partial [Mesorhabditis belari]|uniref:ShKT domain-containing protein n=1 Tax=Mesorhabditis belari TaxID=2138241 RepID=A0AAF3FJH5_9BILA
MPCCLESLGISTCSRLKKRGLWFYHKCHEDADFAIIQCCHTCKTNVPELGSKLFAKGSKSLQCFDRHGPAFCQKFLQPDEMTGTSKCSGANASFGFRLCRRSCGFCEPEIYQEKRHDGQCPVIG